MAGVLAEEEVADEVYDVVLDDDGEDEEEEGEEAEADEDEVTAVVTTVAVVDAVVLGNACRPGESRLYLPL